MPKSISTGLSISVLAHALALIALSWRLAPINVPKEPKIEFIEIEHLEEEPREPIKEDKAEPQQELPRAEASVTELQSHIKKTTKNKASQATAAANTAAASSADAPIGGAAEGLEATTPDGTEPIGGKGPILPGQLNFSAGDFQAIKDSLHIPRTKGKIEKNLPMEAIPSFTPSAITAGNQAPLRELLAPFSGYLRSMHIKIHPLWSEGALVSFEGMDPDSPLNNMMLELTIEVVINEDGSLESATQRGSSGDSRYDMMAMYAIKNAAPFEAPPKELLSYQNKVYVRWTLYRDIRECAAMLAQPFWITSEEKSGLIAAPQSEAKKGEKKRDDSSAKEKVIAGTKEVAERLDGVTVGGPRPDGFGGVVTMPEHSFFPDANGEVIIMFNLTKNKSAGPPKDELTKRKK